MVQQHSQANEGIGELEDTSARLSRLRIKSQIWRKMNRVSETYGISSYVPTMCNESPKEEEEEKEVESIFEEIMVQTSQMLICAYKFIKLKEQVYLSTKISVSGRAILQKWKISSDSPDNQALREC